MCTQKLAFWPMYTFRMESTESFINETPGDVIFSGLGKGSYPAKRP